MNTYQIQTEASTLFITNSFEGNIWSVLRLYNGKMIVFGGINRAPFRLFCNSYSSYGHIQEDFELE